MECIREIGKPYQLTGAIQMYEATGNEEYKDSVINSLNKLETSNDAAEKMTVQDSLAYFFALEQTGEDKYVQKIELLIQNNDWDLEFMPFVTAYETKYKRKEHYNEIVEKFRGKEQFTGRELVAIINTLDEMSEEIYEYYRELRDLFKTVVKDKIKELPNSSEDIEIGYAILKACNMGVLHSEKYCSFGEQVRKTNVGNDDDRCFGIKEMLEAQYRILKKQEDWAV